MNEQENYMNDDWTLLLLMMMVAVEEKMCIQMNVDRMYVDGKPWEMVVENRVVENRYYPLNWMMLDDSIDPEEIDVEFEDERNYLPARNFRRDDDESDEMT